MHYSNQQSENEDQVTTTEPEYIQAVSLISGNRLDAHPILSTYGTQRNKYNIVHNVYIHNRQRNAAFLYTATISGYRYFNE